MADERVSGPTDYLAAERTFLAWMRAGLALMGLGFVVARFGLFLQTLQVSPLDPVIRWYGASFWFGTAFIILGVIVNVVSIGNHLRLVRDLKRGGSAFERASALGVIVAVTLAATGLAMAVYLVSVRQPAPLRATRAVNITREEKSMAFPQSDAGIITRRSNHSLEQTMQKLEVILRAKGVKLFAVIDHSGEAERAGLQMRPTRLLIFGSPKAGTPLMVASPTAAIDLPLKILVWEDKDGAVQVSYNSPAYLLARHGLPAELMHNIAVVETMVAAAAD